MLHMWDSEIPRVVDQKTDNFWIQIVTGREFVIYFRM